MFLMIQANYCQSQDIKDTKVKAVEIHDMMTGNELPRLPS